MEKFFTEQNQQIKQLVQNNYSNLWNVRIFQKDLLFITGIPRVLAKKELLIQDEFLGQYGKIKNIHLKKVSVQKHCQSQYSFYQAHVRYSNEHEASLALLCLDQLKMNDRHIKVFYGMSRYCPRIIKGKKCYQKDCSYQHQAVSKEDCFLKHDNAKKLFFKYYDKNNIVRNLMKNGHFNKIHQSTDDQNKNIFPTIISVLKKYQLKNTFNSKQKFEHFNENFLKQAEIENLRQKAKFKAIKIEQKIKNLNQQLQIYLSDNFNSNIALGDDYCNSLQIHITNKILYQINTQIKSLILRIEIIKEEILNQDIQSLQNKLIELSILEPES